MDKRVEWRESDERGAIVFGVGSIPSFWRTTDRRYWMAHDCFWGTCKAVTDDHGDLRKVPHSPHSQD